MPPLGIFLPVGAVLTAFLMVAAPVVVLMAVWTAVTMCRILFPEKALPFDRAARRAAARRRGEAVPVGLHDIAEEQRRQPARPVMPRARRESVSTRSGLDADPLRADLWHRRN